MLSVHPITQVKQGIVVAHLPLSQKPAVGVFHILKGLCIPTDLKESKPQGAELSVLLYSLHKTLEYGINGSPSDALKTKMADMKCEVQGKDFIITATTVSSFTAVRKVISVVCKLASQVVAKLKPTYKKYMDQLGLRMDEEELAAVSELVAAGVRGMRLHITGPNIDAEKQKALSEAIKAKLSTAAGMGKGKSPTGGKEPDPEVALKGSKFDCLLMQSYLKFGAKLDSHVCDSAVVPQIMPKRWEAIHGKLRGADKIKRFLDQKLLKLEDKLGDALRMLAAKSGYFTPKDLEDIPAKPTEAQLTAALKKHFA